MANRRCIKSQKKIQNVEVGKYRYKKAWSKHCKRLDHLVKKHYGESGTYLGYRGVDRIIRVENQLLKDVFGYVDSVELLSHKQRESRRERIRELIAKFGRYDIVYVKAGTKPPEGAICANNGSIYLVKARISMPLEKYFLYLIGDAFLSQEDICTALTEWSGVPRNMIYDAYLDVVWFFKNQNEVMNMNIKKRHELSDHLTFDTNPSPIYVETFNNYNFY